jgi:FMN-dependent NADH-azoreductase
VSGAVTILVADLSGRHLPRKDATVKTLLRIDASARLDGSTTRHLTEYFQARWKEANPEGRVIARCLASHPIPHLDQETVERFHVAGSAHSLSDGLIDELRRADHVLIGTPLYNFTLPSTLKAYLDHVVRAGYTFERRDGKYRGLLHGKRATVVTSRGGTSAPGGADDFQTPYLTAILAFIGIDPVDMVALEGTASGRDARETALERARQRVDALWGRPRPAARAGSVP